MQSQSGYVHIRYGASCIQACKNVEQLFNVLAKYAARVSVFVQTLETLVAGRSDHRRSVMRYVTQVK